MLLRLALCAALPLLSLVSCSDAQATPVTDPAASTVALNTVAQPAGTEPASAEPADAVLSGKITFEGTAPERKMVDLKPDPKCHEMHGDAGMEVQGGLHLGAANGIKDVFVQITSGLPADVKYEAPAEPVVLDQRGCTYEPHVFGVMKKQTIKILNSDPTLHNIHAKPKSNKEFNLGMPDQGSVREQEFKKAEEAISIVCDVHPWMQCYSFVMEHPFFAVSGADGTFTLNMRGLPDGEYGVKIWHETLGTHEGKVTLKDSAAKFDHTWKQR
ncbi:MAG: hypothetical protein ACT4PU_06320 [Planctomycetota bacterium]